jgi:beta-xylosidase
VTTEVVSERVAGLLGRMTLEEKLAQIVSFWENDESADVVAPLQGQQTSGGNVEDVLTHGIGHLTRVYGAWPVDVHERAQWLWERQRALVSETRLGIPALVHEECLTGLSAWGAATFPAPLSWGASFDPDLVGEMARLIGETMSALGIHQGLAPVLDVVRDARWGRVEECIAEDPYVVGTIGTAYVRGLQSAGVHATLKHFVGYSGSQAGRNFAPVHVGRRELEDIYFPPFEMAVRDGGVRSVMHAYNEIDGIPMAANEELLTGVLRDRWGFDGVVVADYFGVAFLQTLHGIATDLGDAAAQALRAGVDVELPNGDAYLAPLAEAVRDGRVDIALVDRAVARLLRQKEDLGLLDATFDGPAPEGVEIDSPAHREVARRLAEESVVLVSNDGTLPLLPTAHVAVIGPNADRMPALFGCYSFVNHVISQRPGVESRVVAPTVLEALRGLQPTVSFDAGCDVDSADRSGFDRAVASASVADVAVVVVGDQAGLFGRGTVGEGCDRDDLELPGVQRDLVEAILETGTPVVLVLLTGRPYALGWAIDRCAAIVQSFFPGEEGGTALARVLTGAVNPSGRLPVSLPRGAGSSPYSYLHPMLGGDSEVTSVSSVPVREFGHGLSYTSFRYSELEVADATPSDGFLDVAVTVENTGYRAGSDVLQVYVRDVVGSTTRPMAQLVGYTRVDLVAGAASRVAFRIPTARFAAADRQLQRVVEPGEVEVWIGTSAVRAVEGSTRVTGPIHPVTAADARLSIATVSEGVSHV